MILLKKKIIFYVLLYEANNNTKINLKVETRVNTATVKINETHRSH